MGKIIVKNAVKREPGYLYYIDGSGNICQAEMAKAKKKKVDKVKKTVSKKKEVSKKVVSKKKTDKSKKKIKK